MCLYRHTDTLRGIIRIETVVTGTWLGEQVFQEVHGQTIRPEPMSDGRLTPLAAPGPRPRVDPGQPILRQGNAHGMPVHPARPHANEGAQNNLPTTPNENYQARAAPILARLRAEGVEFNDAPRQFNFARDLARNLRAASPPPAPNRQHLSAAPTVRFISDRHTVWNAATGSEPAVDTDTDLESDPNV
jgi:hypothetical protein